MPNPAWSPDDEPMELAEPPSWVLFLIETVCWISSAGVLGGLFTLAMRMPG